MDGFRTIIDKGTRIIIAVIIMVFFSKLNSNMGNAYVFFDLFSFSFLALCLPSLESIMALIMFYVIKQFNLDSNWFLFVKNNSNNFPMKDLLFSFKIWLIVPVLVITKLKTKSSSSTNILSKAWGSYFFVVAIYYFYLQNYNWWAPVVVFKHIIQNILVYLTMAIIILILAPPIYENINRTSKKLEINKL